MQPTKEFIKKCQEAKAVQEAWEPEVGDCLQYPPNEELLFFFLERNFHGEWDNLGVEKKECIFLPDARWCAEQIKIELYQIIYIPGLSKWNVDICIVGKEIISKSFTHADYDTVHLMAAEYVLSGGKNDLREDK